MHDKNGTPLQKGDVVLIPAIVTELQAGEDFCNVTVESVHGRRPDGLKECISAINTGVLVLHERPAYPERLGPTITGAANAGSK